MLLEGRNVEIFFAVECVNDNTSPAFSEGSYQAQQTFETVSEPSLRIGMTFTIFSVSNAVLLQFIGLEGVEGKMN